MDETRISLVVQPVSQVVRDTLANRRFIGWFAFALIVWIALSSVLFHFAEAAQVDANGHHVNGLLDSIYFTVINVTTVGFGDITPKSDWGKILAMVNAVLGVVMFGFLVAIISAALQPGEFTASGTAVSPEPPRPKSKKPTERTGGDAEPEHPVVSFLRGVNALTGEQGSENPKRVRFRVNVGEGPRLQGETAIDVEILVHRWP